GVTRSCGWLALSDESGPSRNVNPTPINTAATPAMTTGRRDPRRGCPEANEPDALRSVVELGAAEACARRLGDGPSSGALWGRACAGAAKVASVAGGAAAAIGAIGGAGDATGCGAGPAHAPSACASSPTCWNRFAGSFSRHRATAIANPIGTPC